MRSEVLRAESLCKTLSGDRVLQNLTFNVFENETLSILGADSLSIYALIGLLSGSFAPDSGNLYLREKHVSFKSLRQAKLSGIYTIYEKSYLLDNLTIAENVFLGRETGLQSRAKSARAAQPFMQEVGLVHISPNVRITSLSPIQKTLVEIAAALAVKPKVLIFNKAHLFNNDEHLQILRRLFNKLNRLGTAVIYFAENTEYARQLSDRILFMQNGTGISIFEKHLFGSDKFQMNLDVIYPKESLRDRPIQQAPLLKVRSLSGRWIKNVSFSLSPGEILGVFDFDERSKSELLQMIYGLHHPVSGSVYYRGTDISAKKPAAVLKMGISYVPAHAYRENIFLNLSFRENLTISSLKRVCSHGCISKYFEKYYSGKLAAFSNCTDSDLDTPVSCASDSTLRKLLISRSIACRPRVLLLDDPFIGADLATKTELIQCINSLAAKGAAVLIASIHADELKSICSNVIHISKKPYMSQASTACQ